MLLRCPWQAAACRVALAVSALGFSAAALAAPASPAPVLAAPAGAVINVSTEPELQAAMSQLRSDTTVVLAPGTYRLSRTLYIKGGLLRVGLRGATNNPDDVQIIGQGMANASYGGVPYGVWTGDNVQDVTIANLTLRDFFFHCIIFNAGTEQPLVHNVHLVDSGEQFVKSNPDNQGGGVDGGRVQYSTFEFTARARDSYPKGIDIHTGVDWTIAHNLFRNLQAPAGQLLGPAILVWHQSRNTTVESNTFVNCQREIMFGVYDLAPNEHEGGVIRNNMIYRDPSVLGDVGIAVFDSPDTQVLHNTVLTSGTYPSAIEYRYQSAINVYIANNLTDAAIRQRDGAQAVLQNNVTTATGAMFVAAAAGDLHLLGSAAAAIDAGALGANVAVDWDGHPRPQGASSDVGADELTVSAQPPPPPPPPTGNAAPTVYWVSPTSAVDSPLRARVAFEAAASDRDGSVLRVDFYIGTTLIRRDARAPFTGAWKPDAPGVYQLTAVAVDDLGAQTTSTAIQITVR